MTNTQATRPADIEKTPLEGVESGFVAPTALRVGLQRAVVDLINLQLVGKQAHWNIVGPNFRDLHLNLDEVVQVARRGADTLAERMRALHATVDGRVETVAAGTSLPVIEAGEILTHDAIDMVVRAIEVTVQTMREIHGTVDDTDPTSASLLEDYIAELEQQAWFISAETRTPRR